MRGLKNKRGISLIVLVITIIVMIILAAAIILSISNSGIMDKANKAKTDSDDSNLKEYVNVLEAEWKLRVAEASDQTKSEYINTKLAEKGYNRKVTEEGVLLTESATKALDDGIQIGDEVKYIITDVKMYKVNSEKVGASDNVKLTTQTNLKWVYIGISEEGELLITPDVSSGTLLGNILLSGATGWLTGADELNTICDELYTIKGKGKARSINIDDINRLLGYTGAKGGLYYTSNWAPAWEKEAKTIGELEKKLGIKLTYRIPPNGKGNIEDYYSDYYVIEKEGSVGSMEHPENIELVYPNSGAYWLASPSMYAYFCESRATFVMRLVSSSQVASTFLYYSYDHAGAEWNSFRPVVSLEANIQKSTENRSTVWNIV